jgi:beta-fructofuranosidase
MSKLLTLIAFLTTLYQVVDCQMNGENVKRLITDDKPVPGEAIMAARDLRLRLLSDPYRPAYHFCFPEDNGRPGDPNGAFYYKGKYHLMFLYNKTGSGFAWGHVSSTDLLHWRYHPDAIFPGNGDDGCFSGGAFVDDDGSAVLSYWMLWGDKGIGLAHSEDPDFNLWKKSDVNPVIKSTEWGITELTGTDGKKVIYGSADPSNIWKKDGHYYILTGNLLVLRKFGSRGTGLPANPDNGPALPADSVKYQGDGLSLLTSDDLKSWKYLHDFYKSDRKWTSKNEDNMCPVFLPLPLDQDGGKPSGKHLLLFISHNRGCQYYTGVYKNDNYIPETHGRMTWNDNAYFAPEALTDNKGRLIMWSWIFDDRPDSVINKYGWTGMYGLPRSLWMGSDGRLRISPAKELNDLRMKKSEIQNIRVGKGAEKKVDAAGRELQEIKVTFQPGKATMYGIKVCMSDDGREETVIYYDATDKMLKFDTRKSGLSYGRKMVEEAPLELKNGEPLVLNIFIDKSIVEVFANDKQAIARTIYPTLGGHGISLFSEGADVTVPSFKTWAIAPSNPY